ncbi:MAG TPA: hypothetical protein VGD74_04135, partial [Vulgatibacter sp.]
EFGRPQLVTGDGGYAAISAGGIHTCALDGTGQAYCWGMNESGQLGTGHDWEDLPGSPAPVPVFGTLFFDSISAGGSHTCALEGETAWCWGANFDGALGVGDDLIYSAALPLPVAGEHEFTQIVAAAYNTCALDSDGAAWCWGYNEFGAVGDGSDVAISYEPVAVAGGHVFDSIAGTGSHLCGLTAAGEAWCWGGNEFGQLGSSVAGFAWSSNVPVPVDGGLVFRTIAPAANHTCALDEDGSAWCWGNDDYGQLGWANPGFGGPEPVRVHGGLAFESIAASGTATCARTADGSSWCWGHNGSGVLGGGWVNGVSPVPWPVAQPD